MHTSSGRILFIIDYYHPHIGGLEIVFEHIIKRLQARGYTIGILTTKHMSTLPQYEHLDGIDIWRVGSSRNNFLRWSLRRGRKIIQQYDSIHTTTYASAIPASLLGRRYQKKTILTVHEVFGPTLWKRYKLRRSRFYQWFEQIIFWFPYTTIVCVSHYTKKMLHRLYLPTTPLQVIHNGIDTTVRNISHKNIAMIDQFITTHQLQEKYILLYYGHSGASKGLDHLLYALPTLITHIPHIHLVINLLPGKRDHKILDLAKKLCVQDNITFLHGVQQDMLVNLVYMSKAVIVPSVSEGFGLVAAEVSSIGHPLIVTRRASLPEVVHGKVAFLDDYAPQSFLHAVQQIQTQQRENIPPKVFDREKTIDAYEKLYI